MKDRKSLFNNGYMCIGAGTVTMFFLGAMYAWTYFKVALQGVYIEWSQTQITLNFTIMMISFCLGGLLAGTLSKKVTSRMEMALAAVLVGLGFLGMSLLPEEGRTALYQMYICYGVCTGTGIGIAYNTVLSNIQPWAKNVGLVSGMLLMGMGFGALLLGNVADILIGHVGVAMTFRIFAILMILIMVLAIPFIHKPSEMKTAAAGAAWDPINKEYSTKEMLRRKTFWMYFFWNICVSAGGMLIINSASSIAVYFGYAAVLGLVISVFNGCGRLLIGSIMDKSGWKFTMYLNNMLMILAGVLLFSGDRIAAGAVALAGMLIMGICYGGGITISASLIRTLYGERHYASNFAICNLCLIPASIAGPLLSARLLDMAGGSYNTTFIMVIVLGIITLAMNFFIKEA
ncbi:MFS transporter [Ihubacter massiliensis]|uniref:MFS transporter n=1 Tax=Hominibacterium faecale TaxID=2839743 RepID=A0A9J6QP35_9FIRM|nr:MULTISPECIES: MFS transporter [Eubacteriales Family XIII. Incertae Sedis]MCO7122926.1 MFS transporter [Ihubacter massiliensis]MCU7377188.1 MFS transporter [Hominibacterium faecale]